MNVINFEGPISVNSKKATRKSGPNISQDPDAPVFLKEHGFKLFSLANNHSMDYGSQALDATIKSTHNKAFPTFNLKYFFSISAIISVPPDEALE